jgi:cyclase
MLKVRVIPVLLLRQRGLVKSIRFKDHIYVGDPVNAIRIFNEKEVDELVVLDIDCSRQGAEPNYDLIRDFASECFMPLSYGGGIQSAAQARRLFGIGVEKVIVNQQTLSNPQLVREIADIAGSSSAVVCIDVKKTLFGGYRVYDHKTGKTTNIDPRAHAESLAKLGAGEVIVNSVDCDGMREGYDLELIRQVAQAVDVPVIACGGAGKLQHMVDAVKQGGASAVAAGSMFVFHGKWRAVLITYPNYDELERAFA